MKNVQPIILKEREIKGRKEGEKEKERESERGVEEGHGNFN